MKSERYHHGDLREALIGAAERELAEKGEDGFSLRSVAKRAGVSHAAPAHHFKDRTALLHGLAETGFNRLTAAMKAEQARADPGDPEAQLIGVGIGYIRFAMEDRHLFQLMFGGRPGPPAPLSLAKAADAAFSVLVNGVARVRGQDALRSESGWRDVTACWSMVHGYAHLANGGKMGWITDQSLEAQRPAIEDMLRRAMTLPPI